MSKTVQVFCIRTRNSAYFNGAKKLFGHDESAVTSSLDSDGGDQVEIDAESGKRRVDDRKSYQEPVSSSVTGNPRVAVGTKGSEVF